MYRSAIAVATALVVAGLTAVGAPARAAVPSGVAQAIPVGGTQPTEVTSPNWSGYVAQATARFTAASGSWTQPAARCAGSTHSVAAFWVGLDGYQNQTVEQIGVQAACTGGIIRYFAWWQMWPAPVTDLSPASFPVRPGATLAASVTRSAQRYTLSLGSSTGWRFHTTQKSNAAAASAEWIASSPRLCHSCQFAPLTNFGTVTFSNVEAAAGGALRPLSTFGQHGGPTALRMVTTSGTTRAVPGSVGSDGRSFRDRWGHA